MMSFREIITFHSGRKESTTTSPTVTAMILKNFNQFFFYRANSLEQSLKNIFLWMPFLKLSPLGLQTPAGTTIIVNYHPILLLHYLHGTIVYQMHSVWVWFDGFICSLCSDSLYLAFKMVRRTLINKHQTSLRYLAFRTCGYQMLTSVWLYTWNHTNSWTRNNYWGQLS